ncbi:MAG: tetratricopeptide repeat protein [Bacteroidota bacterium]
MNEIFISYKHEDEKRVSQFVQVCKGHSFMWMHLALLIVIALLTTNIAIAQPTSTQPVNARAEVAAALYAASATQAAVERVADQKIRGLRDDIESLRTSLAVTTGEKTVLRHQLMEAEEDFVAALEEKDRTYKEEIAVFRDAVEDIIKTSEGLYGLARFNAGEDEVAFEIWDKLVVARAAAREVAKNIENAKDKRSVAVFALESRARGKKKTAEVIARYEEVTHLDPGLHWDWVELGRLYRDAGNIFKAEQSALRAKETARTDRDQVVSFNELGIAHSEQGNLKDALINFSNSKQIAQHLTENDPENTLWQQDLSVSLYFLGNVQLAQGELPAALASFSQSKQINERLIQADSSNLEFQRHLAVSLDRLGDLARAKGDLAIALENRQKAMRLIEFQAWSNPGDAKSQQDLSVLHINIGDSQAGLGDLNSALTSFEKAKQIRTKLAQSDPTNAVAQHNLAVTHDRIAKVYQEQWQLSEALANYTEGKLIREDLIRTDPKNARWRYNLSISLSNIGDIAFQQGNYNEAQNHLNKSLQLSKILVETDSSNTLWQRGYAKSLNRIGDLFFMQGKLSNTPQSFNGAKKNFKEALEYFKMAMKIRKRLVTTDASNTRWQSDLAISLTRIGDTNLKLWHYDKALESYNQALQIRKRLTQVDPQNVNWQNNLAIIHAKLGDTRRAFKNPKKALEHYSFSVSIGERLVQIDSSKAGAHHTILSALYKMCEVSGNKSYAKRALEIAYYMRDQGMLEGQKELIIALLEGKLK